jgi:6,7-dimethyl-8-ribityllumazine synthase
MACGVEEQHIFRLNVPGSFELVFGAKKALEQQVDAVIVIGSVIQGETKHFDFICQGVTRGIVSLNLRSNRPVVFCVLTDNTLQQAIDRSGGQHGNKGVEAAVTALKMVALAQQ